MKKWALDTNILVYFLDRNSPFHSPTVAVFEEMEDSGKELVLTDQNLLELLNVLHRHYHLAFDVCLSNIDQILKHTSHHLHPTSSTLSLFLELLNRNQHLNHQYDVYLTATLLDQGVTTLVTNNPKDFAGIPGLKVVPLNSYQR